MPQPVHRGRGGPRPPALRPLCASTERELHDDDLAFDATLRERTRMADALPLRGAVGRIVEALRVRNRIEITVAIDPDAERYNDPVVRETVRELTTSIAQHAPAGTVATVRLPTAGPRSDS